MGVGVKRYIRLRCIDWASGIISDKCSRHFFFFAAPYQKNVSSALFLSHIKLLGVFRKRDGSDLSRCHLGKDLGFFVCLSRA